jgi:hypothetical protein
MALTKQRQQALRRALLEASVAVVTAGGDVAEERDYVVRQVKYLADGIEWPAALGTFPGHAGGRQPITAR